MKKVLLVLVLSVLVSSCQELIKPKDIAKLNGYWEIQKVTFEKGGEKEYKMNESFDFFELKENKGIRKKVMPQLDGTFIVNSTFENVSVRFVGDQVFLDYKTPYAKWTEELLTLTEDEFVVVNKEKEKYQYKKAGPINIIDNGKEAK